MKLLLCVLIIALQFKDSGCILGSIKHWLFGDHHQNVVDKALSQSGAKFEVVSTDEKFLKFANELNDMSPLDACYHIVIIFIYILKNPTFMYRTIYLHQLNRFNFLNKINMQMFHCVPIFRQS